MVKLLDMMELIFFNAYLSGNLSPGEFAVVHRQRVVANSAHVHVTTKQKFQSRGWVPGVQGVGAVFH